MNKIIFKLQPNENYKKRRRGEERRGDETEQKARADGSATSLSLKYRYGEEQKQRCRKVQQLPVTVNPN